MLTSSSFVSPFSSRKRIVTFVISVSIKLANLVLSNAILIFPSSVVVTAMLSALVIVTVSAVVPVINSIESIVVNCVISVFVNAIFTVSAVVVITPAVSFVVFSGVPVSSPGLSVFSSGFSVSSSGNASCGSRGSVKVFTGRTSTFSPLFVTTKSNTFQ